MATAGIGKGGTGATTAADALSNLGAMPVAGGTMTGNLTLNGKLILKNGVTYGAAVPASSGIAGEIFLKLST